MYASERKRSPKPLSSEIGFMLRLFLVARASSPVSPLRALLPVVSIVAMNSIGSYVSGRAGAPGVHAQGFRDRGALGGNRGDGPLDQGRRSEEEARGFGVALLLVQIGMGGAVVLTALRAELVAVHMALASSVLATYSMLATVIV